MVISLLAGLATQERIRISERVRAGLERARKQGKELGRRRKASDRGKAARLRAEGASWSKIATSLHVPLSTVRRACAGLGQNRPQEAPGQGSAPPCLRPRPEIHANAPYSILATVPENRQDGAASDAVPESPVFGKPKKDLGPAVLRFARRLRSDYAEQFATDEAARKFKKRVVTMLRRNMPPFAGRPPEESVTRAIQLRRLGGVWKHIYPEVTPDYRNLDRLRRRQAEFNLGTACRSRRNARRRGKRLVAYR